MAPRTVLHRYFGWEVRRLELAAATAVAVLGCGSAALFGGGPVALGFALLTGFATALLLRGDVGALRGDDADEWLAFVGLGYLLLGAFGVLNATSIVALSLSGFSPGLGLTLLLALAIAAVFLGRGAFFVTVTR